MTSLGLNFPNWALYIHNFYIYIYIELLGTHFPCSLPPKAELTMVTAECVISFYCSPDSHSSARTPCLFHCKCYGKIH